MGLGIAQVRLLALTHRKSDIELEMSIDSKRKQQLTRKSTELSQTYYSRLNNYNYQYSTKGGYNDLDYNYLMGHCNTNGSFTTEFLNQIYDGQGDLDLRIDNNVVLTDNQGRAILNNELTTACQWADIYGNFMADSGEEVTHMDKVSYAIWDFIKTSAESNPKYEELRKGLQDEYVNDGSWLSDSEIVDLIQLLMEVGGAKNGGTVYVCNGTYGDGTTPAYEWPSLRRIQSLNSTGGTGISTRPDYGSLGYSPTYLLSATYNPEDITANSQYYSAENWGGDGNLATYKIFNKLSYEARQNNFYTNPELTGAHAYLKEGYCYTVVAIDNGKQELTAANECLWDGNQFIPKLRYSYLQKLNNLINYLSPTLSAAIRNGYTSTVNMDNSNPSQGYYDTSSYAYSNYEDELKAYLGQTYKDGLRTFECWHAAIVLLDGTTKNFYIKNNGAVYTSQPSGCTPVNAAAFGHKPGVPASIIDKYISEQSGFNNNSVCKVKYCSGMDMNSMYYGGYGWSNSYSYRYYIKLNDTIYSISQSEYNNYVSGGNTSIFQAVQDTDTLQAGLKSGAYQLSLVTNLETGSLMKNTTMDYFVHRNLCIEKVDTSKREELTAWYNAEQAAISEQENYWDEEISNLSTELTSINSEIDSVKNLKTNAIKSVFGWGGQ